MRQFVHPEDRDYDRGPASPWENPVSGDLLDYYREVKRGKWGYVCPCCHNIFPPGLAGMPIDFRNHVAMYLAGNGCSFNIKTKSDVGSKHSRKSEGF